jgi:hypothetical protein
MKKILKNQKGMTLPFVMIAILVGALVIPAFVGHAGTSLIGSRNYRNALDAQYACDSGAEHAIWSLVEGGLIDSIPEPGDSTTYNLDETINGLTAGVTVSNSYEIIAWDDFNSGGWTGGGGWLENWAHSGAASITTSGAPYEGTYHLQLSSSTGFASRPVDLSHQVGAHLLFWSKVSGFESDDSAICQVSPDGSAWTTIYTWNNSNSDNTYYYHDIDLLDYGLSGSFYISFDSNTNNSADYLYIDNLEIAWLEVPFDVVAEDQFSTGNWTDGSGWLSGWTHAGNAEVTSIGEPYSPSHHARLWNSSGVISRAVDLEGQIIVHWQFWAKAINLDPSDQVLFQVSSDGSTWETVYTFSNGEDTGAWRYYELDISDYTLTDEFWIRYDGNQNRDDEEFWVDDIKIEATRVFYITVRADDRILKAVVDLMGGVETILCWYFLV